jgi:aldose 1-epimerase
MKTVVKKYGYLDDRDLCEISLINDNGMQVKILNYGATLEKIEIPTSKGLENIIMSLTSPEDYSKGRNYLGGTIGRVAGRIKKGQWKHGNQITQFPINEGENSMHGGEGIDTRPWTFQPKYNDSYASVEFEIFDYDGANGYPGNMKIKATYRLDNDNNLNYHITAMTDKTTLFNPTNHTYFRLDGDQHDVTDLNLKVNADYYIPVDENTMPVKGAKKVDGTPFDFRKSKHLNEVINSDVNEIKIRNGLDHPFILNGNQPAAVLTSNRSNRKLIMSTDAPAVVIYSGNSFNHTGIAKNLGRHDGITLEAQVAPQSGCKLDPLVLLPGEKFSRRVNWKVVY